MGGRPVHCRVVRSAVALLAGGRLHPSQLSYSEMSPDTTKRPPGADEDLQAACTGEPLRYSPVSSSCS